jgi:hypothetical protein
MPATRTITTLAPAITQANLGAAVRTAMAPIAGTPIDEFTDASGNLQQIYRLNFNAKAAGTVFLQIQLTAALVFSQRLHIDWNTVTRTSPSIAVSTALIAAPTTVAIIANAAITLTTFSHPEVAVVMLQQQSAGTLQSCFLGYVRPGLIDQDWNEEIYPYCFIPTDLNLEAYAGLIGARSPYNHAAGSFYAIESNPRMSGISPLRNKPDIYLGSGWFSPTNAGSCGKFTTEIARACGTGAKRGDILQVTPGVEEYVLFRDGANGLALRVAVG